LILLISLREINKIAGYRGLRASAFGLPWRTAADGKTLNLFFDPDSNSLQKEPKGVKSLAKLSVETLAKAPTFFDSKNATQQAIEQFEEEKKNNP